MYMVAPEGTQPALLMPGAIQYSGPTTQLATEIFNETNITVPSGGLGIESSIVPAIPYSTYDLNIQAYCGSQNNNNAPLVGIAVLQWYIDSAGTMPVGSPDIWNFWLSNSSTNISAVSGSGPIRGNYFSITFLTPPGASETFLVTSLQMWGSSRVPPNTSDWRQAPPVAGAMNSGLTMYSAQSGYNATNGQADLVLYNINNVTVPASETYWQPLPLFAGPVYSRVSIGTTWSQEQVLCTGLNLLNGSVQAGASAQGIIIAYPNTASQEEEQFCYAAQAPNYFVIHTSSSSVTWSYTLLGQRQS